MSVKSWGWKTEKIKQQTRKEIQNIKQQKTISVKKLSSEVPSNRGDKKLK